MKVSERLAAIGFHGSIPKDCHSFPRSDMVPAALRGSLKHALSGALKYGWPGIAEQHQGWNSKTYDDNIFCEAHQGFVFSGKHWFFSQEGGTIRQCLDGTVDRPRPGPHVGTASVPGKLASRYTHMGELDYVPASAFPSFSEWASGWGPDGHPASEGLVFAAMEGLGKYDCGLALAFWDDMSGDCRAASSPLIYRANSAEGPPIQNGSVLVPQCSCPWVAVNPWDGLLYSAPFKPFVGPNGGSLIHVYDMNDRYELTREEYSDYTLRLLAAPLDYFESLDVYGNRERGYIPVFRFTGTLELSAYVREIQGGCFSNDGCLYLINNGDQEHGVYRFSVLNGSLLDVIGVSREESAQECEGVCLYGGKAVGADRGSMGGAAYVCATVWVWNASGDVVWFKTMPLGQFVP